MTYSIVARDDATGQIGVAVQTCMFAAGSIVPWARPGVGAVATQAVSEAAYGPRCLDALETGASAADALAQAQAADPMAALRQVGVVGADGSLAVSTGALCIAHAGDVTGEGFVVQANMMSTPEVWPAMAKAFDASTATSLAHRLLDALVAAEAAGGDARGRMSAALLVVDGMPSASPGAGKIVDIRVDHSDDPVGELSRLLVAADAFSGFHRAVDQLFSGDAHTARDTLDGALEKLPGDENLRFLRSGALMATGAVEAGVEELRSLVSKRPTWEVIVRSFVTQGMIHLPEGVSLDTLFD